MQNELITISMTEQSAKALLECLAPSTLVQVIDDLTVRPYLSDKAIAEKRGLATGIVGSIASRWSPVILALRNVNFVSGEDEYRVALDKFLQVQMRRPRRTVKAIDE